ARETPGARQGVRKPVGRGGQERVHSYDGAGGAGQLHPGAQALLARARSAQARGHRGAIGGIVLPATGRQRLREPQIHVPDRAGNSPGNDGHVRRRPLQPAHPLRHQRPLRP
ncbi:unnamed protein product, partial [Ectocarpus sp. 12 AP-2014]